MATKAHSFMPATYGAELIAAENNYTSDSEDDELEYEAEGMKYVNTPITGYYTRELADFARHQYLKHVRGRQPKRKYTGCTKKVVDFFTRIWLFILSILGEDFVFLALLGFLMACTIHLINRGVAICNSGRMWLWGQIAINQHYASQYFAWIALPVVLILFSTAFTDVVSPAAKGSGMAPVKTMIRGVVIRDAISFRTLISKAFGVTATIGANMPLGKEGPCVHIGAAWTANLARFVSGFQGIYRNEARFSEMLAVGAAVGVSCCFLSPIGGVLFGIELTTTYYYVRNYWRAFYCAVWGALMLSLFDVWCTGKHTLMPKFKAYLNVDFAFDVQEVFVYALIGLCTGLGSGIWIILHTRWVLFTKSKVFKAIFRWPYLYPFFISASVASLTFPPSAGQFFASHVGTGGVMKQLFSNFSWTDPNLTIAQKAIVDNWTTYRSGIFAHLPTFIAYNYFLSMICTTLPVPAGCFVPVFKVGAAFGRIIGELMNTWFPDGIYYFGRHTKIMPSGYAMVGAASFQSGISQTISVTLICIELCGQVTHVIPILIAVLLANAVSGLLTPSMYDSMIIIKGLPYLPDLVTHNSGFYNVYIEDFMDSDVRFIYNRMTYKELIKLLKARRDYRCFPLVNDPDQKILVGSISRIQLLKLLDRHIGEKRRKRAAALRRANAEEQRRMDSIKRAASRFTVEPVDKLVIRHESESSSDDRDPTIVRAAKNVIDKYNEFVKKGYHRRFLSTDPSATPFSPIEGANMDLNTGFPALYKKIRPGDEEDQKLFTGTEGFEAVLPQHIRDLEIKTDIDMSPAEQRIWEAEQLELPVDFSPCHVDPTPFQIVERTCLVKVHGVFSMMRLDLAFVTDLGKLKGMLTLDGLRDAISDVKSGKLKAHDLEIPLKRRSRTPEKEKLAMHEENEKQKKQDVKQKKGEEKQKKEEEKQQKKEEEKQKKREEKEKKKEKKEDQKKAKK